MRRSPVFLAPLALLLVLNLAACGNKGPLVRPSAGADGMEVEDIDDRGRIEDADERDSDALDAGAEAGAEADPEAGAEEAVDDPPHPSEPGNG